MAASFALPRACLPQPAGSDNGRTMIGAEQALDPQSQIRKEVVRSAAREWPVEASVGVGTEGASHMENRRRLHRQPAGWAASYQLAGEPASGWRDCRVVDISMLGLGIMFNHPNPAQLSGRVVSVNLPGGRSCVNVRLEGEIKNAVVTMNRDVRVGIEFVQLSETEQAITAVLSVMSDVLASN